MRKIIASLFVLALGSAYATEVDADASLVQSVRVSQALEEAKATVILAKESFGTNEFYVDLSHNNPVADAMLHTLLTAVAENKQVIITFDNGCGSCSLKAVTIYRSAN